MILKTYSKIIKCICLKVIHKTEMNVKVTVIEESTCDHILCIVKNWDI